jgi:hypothetical protein
MAAAFSDPVTSTAATTPTSRWVRPNSSGVGGSERRMVIGRSLVAGLSLSPRPFRTELPDAVKVFDPSFMERGLRSMKSLIEAET